MHIIESIAQQAGAMAALRRDLHAHPELRFEENRTADIVVDLLESLFGKSTLMRPRP